MLIKQVIVNASPLIVLFKSQQAELLPQLFPEILVPEAVWSEILAAGTEDVAAQQLPKVSWAQKVRVETISTQVSAWDLGKGESAVLSLALTLPDCRVIIDDRAARRCAKTHGIATLGTGGVLILAKRRGLISSVSSRLQALRDAGLWLSEDLCVLLKQQAGE